MKSSLALVLFSCAFLGFRHGFDYDHIAAITDIAGIEGRVRATMRLGLMYALGHAAMVATLGGAVIAFQLALPPGIDGWAERVVGLTLMVLALYVFSTLFRRKRRDAPRSRGALMLRGAQWLHWRAHRLVSGNRALKLGPAPEVNGATCFGIGLIHGLGAETPSQLALFLLAANLGGVSRGLLGLAMFLAGLLTMNTLMTASAAGVFTAGRGWQGWTPLLTGLTAAYSFGIGLVFLLGRSNLLRSISG